MNTLTTLKHYFGHAGFRPFQETVIDAILARQDVLMVLPTGGGKSLCYQLPTLLMDGVTVVISPLLALMHDQVTALNANGISAGMISSMQTHEAIDTVFHGLAHGTIRLLYVAPERISNGYFLERLKKIPINFFVVDEAHCVSEWGHEFREDYRKLSVLRTHFPETPVAAFTATATDRVEQDIASQLVLRNPVRVRGSLFRENLTLRATHRIQDGKAQLLAFLKAHTGEAGIVYTLSRKSTESLAAYLQAQGIRARPYHAGLATEEKHTTYADFVADRIEVVVATIAFGMGIDKSNIRFVVHMRLPKTIENYYQEIGRAGRDGLSAETLLLFGAQDVVQQRRFLDQLPEGPYHEHAVKKLDAMVRFARGDVCRHQAIAAYFGETIAPCGRACDACTMPPSERTDITTPARQLLSAIWRTGQRFGLHAIIDILRGSQDQRLKARGHDRLRVYGIGMDYSRAQWRTIGDRLLELEAIEAGDYHVLRITNIGAEILKGRQDVQLKKERLHVQKEIEKKQPLDLEGDDAVLFEALRGLRMEIATANHIPPYVVFSDKALKAMAVTCPTDTSGFLAIHGVGAVKFERYGEEFLALLRRSKEKKQG